MRTRSHPIFVARVQGIGCGHQHSVQKAAVNCAKGILARSSSQISKVDVIQVTHRPFSSETLEARVLEVFG